MSHVDHLFFEILRFSIIAFVLLLTTQVSIRFLNQPLERMRLIQISLFVLVAALVLGLVGGVPVVDVALLPVDDTSSAAANRTSAVATGGPRSSTPVEDVELSSPPFDGGALDSSDETISAGGASRRVPSATAEANTISVDSTSDVGFIASFKKVFVHGFLLISFLNAVYLAIGFGATYRLIAGSTPLSAAATERVERIINRFAKPAGRHLVRSAKIDVPMVSGVWRPLVLLPESMTGGDADEMQLKHGLAHEWGHIERHDLLMWQLVSLCQVFLWIQPCYWVLRRELRIAQDQPPNP